MAAVTGFDAARQSSQVTAMSENAQAAAERHELPLRGELQRKGLHLLALVIPALMLVLGKTNSLLLLVPISALAVGADVLRSRSEPFRAWIERFFGFMMRPEEKPPTGRRPVLNGATWVLISATILAVLFPIDLAGAAFAAFMVADAAAAVVGRTLGRKHWGSSPRTVEGSLAFVVLGLLVMVPLTTVSVLGAAASVLAGAVVEIPRWAVNDNVRVPLVMTLVLYLV